MTPAVVHAAIGELPYMTLEEADTLFDFITSRRLHACLELGFYHGVSSAYIAAALDEMGQGTLVTVDRHTARQLAPNIEEVLSSVQLTHRVTWFYEEHSYHWRLMKFLEQGWHERFDFCYIDGGHTWTDTGFAFCLVSRLLKPGGWILFDDLHWTHQRAFPHDTVAGMSQEERQTPQVGKVFDLLVRTDPQFDTFLTEGAWGFARKRGPLSS